MANELIPGAQAVMYVEREVTYGTERRVTGANAFRTISETFTPAEERINRPDRTGSADVLERVRGRKSGTWEVTKLFLPNGNVTTEPDDTHVWENAFGRISLGATSIEYLMATAHTSSLTLRRGVRTGGQEGTAEFQEHMSGCIANRTEITWGNQGNDGMVQVSFSGDGKRWGYTGNTSVGAGYLSIATGAGSFRMSNAKQVSEGGAFTISTKSDTGGGSGILVDTVNYTNNVVAFSETLGATTSSGAVIKPYNPTESVAGSPIHARLGYLSLDGSTSQIQHLGGRVTLEDNRGLLNEEVGTDAPTRTMRNDRRNVTFQLDFLIKKDEIGVLLADMNRNTAKDIEVTLGTEANKKLKLVMANGEFDLSPLDIGQEMARISMAGVALGTNGNDSLKVRIL